MVRRLNEREVAPVKLSTRFLCGSCKSRIVGYYSSVLCGIEHLFEYCPNCGKKVKWRGINEDY